MSRRLSARATRPDVARDPGRLAAMLVMLFALTASILNLERDLFVGGPIGLVGSSPSPTGALIALAAAPRPGGSIAGLTLVSRVNGLVGLDLSGLFTYAPPGSGFLVEGDGAFTNQDAFLSSTYFLDALGYNPATTEEIQPANAH